MSNTILNQPSLYCILVIMYHQKDMRFEERYLTRFALCTATQRKQNGNIMVIAPENSSTVKCNNNCVESSTQLVSATQWIARIHYRESINISMKQIKNAYSHTLINLLAQLLYNHKNCFTSTVFSYQTNTKQN